MKDTSPFLLGHWCPCCGILVRSAVGFKARVDPLQAFSLVWSSDSPLVWYLLTVMGSASQPRSTSIGVCFWALTGLHLRQLIKRIVPTRKKRNPNHVKTLLHWYQRVFTRVTIPHQNGNTWGSKRAEGQKIICNLKSVTDSAPNWL